MNINIHLIYPMFTMVLLTIVVAILMTRARVSAVRSKQMRAAYFKTYSEGQQTEAVMKTGRHFSNLFEVPVIFYAGCLVAMIFPLSGFWIEFWAWLFVITRIFHAYIHIGANQLYLRMSIFFLSCVAVLCIWIQILLAAISVA